MLTLTQENLQTLINRLSLRPNVGPAVSADSTVVRYDFTPGGGMAIIRDGGHLYCTSLIIADDFGISGGHYQMYFVKTYSLTGGAVSSISPSWRWNLNYGSTSAVYLKNGNITTYFSGDIKEITLQGPDAELSGYYSEPNILARQLYQRTKFWTCFIKGSKVKLSDGSYKNIEDIVPGDELPYITDAGLPATTVVVAPPHKGTCPNYVNYIFEDGTVLPIYKHQGIWCEEQQKYVTILNWEIGWTTKKVDGTLVKLVAKEEVQKDEEAEDFEHYFLYTYNGNYSVNDILTCTSRLLAYNAYVKEKRNGSEFALPDDKVRLWKKENSESLHRRQPLQDFVCQTQLMEANNIINANQIKIEENKVFLNDTDYKIQKYLEGALSEEEFQLFKTERASKRSIINELEDDNKNMLSKIDNIKLHFTNKPSRPRYASVAPDSQVLMADGTYKAIKDIQVGEEIQYLSDDKSCVRTHKVVLPVEPEYVWDYKLYTFEDGTQIKINGQTNLFNVQLNKYYPDKELKIGDKVRKADGTEVAVTAIDKVELDNEETFYRISTRNGNYSINDIQALVSTIRVYDEMMWEENEPYRLSEEEMEKWKTWCDAHRN